MKKTITSTEGWGGGYYLDDGPELNPPSNLDAVPDAVPRPEPLKASTMRPYTALGKTYTPMTALQPYRERGQASWYGKRYHGKNTASGEIYDMYTMTAAHPTLPIPSYARVTNLQNGSSVIVRINDRGPFLSDRLIDLSYVAAYKLGALANGNVPVEVKSIIPGRASSVRPNVAQQQFDAKSKLASSADVQKVYLQLAAFGSVHNARNYLARFRSDFPSITHQSRIDTSSGLYKILIGPFSDLAVANRTSDVISESSSVKPILIEYSGVSEDAY